MRFVLVFVLAFGVTWILTARRRRRRDAKAAADTLHWLHDHGYIDDDGVHVRRGKG